MKKTILLSFLFLFILGIGSQAQQRYPQRFVAGEMYVKIKNNSNIHLPAWNHPEEAQALLSQGLGDLYALVQQYDIQKLRQAFITRGEELDNIYYLVFDPGKQADKLLMELQGLDYVAYAEKVPYCYPTYIPNDYDSLVQYYLRVIDAPYAWDVTKGSAEVKIAIVDNAVLITHPDLAPNIWINPGEIPNNGVDDDGNGYIDDISGWDTADNDNDPNTPAGAPGFAGFNHGTCVAGCASAATDNNFGIAGTGFNCKLIGIKIKSSINITDNLFSGADALEGIDYAVTVGADVVNTSFIFGGTSAIFQAVIDQGHANGTVFVGGAGNSSTNIAYSPASLNHVISVAATNGSDRKAGFSTFNSTVDISAPGSAIRTTSHSASLNPTYVNIDGTSFSSPIVAGVVGLIKAANPCLSPDDIEQILKSTADNINSQNPNYTGLLGAGRVNAGAALRAAQLTAAPVAKFDIDSTDICEGIARCVFTPNSPNCADSIAWSVNGQISQSFTPAFFFDSAGTYTISLYVKNALGNDQSSKTIYVSSPLRIDAGGNDADQLFACFGQSKQIPATSNKSSATYRWSPPVGLNNPNLLNPEMIATASRTYTLTATDTSGCVVSKEVDIVLAVAPTADAGADESITFGGSVQLQTSSSGNGLTFLWTPGQALSDSTLVNPLAKPDVTTTFTFQVTDNNGCTDEDKMTVNVRGVGIDKGLNEGMKLLLPYPNPARDIMNLGLELKKAADIRLSLYDLKGKKVNQLYKGSAAAGLFPFVWERGDLQAGMYLLMWEVDGRQTVQKVIWN